MLRGSVWSLEALFGLWKVRIRLLFCLESFSVLPLPWSGSEDFFLSSLDLGLKVALVQHNLRLRVVNVEDRSICFEFDRVIACRAGLL